MHSLSNIILYITIFLFTGNCYLLHLAEEQVSVFSRRTDITRAAKNPDLDKTTRSRLAFIQELGEFAVGRLHLSEEGKFRYYAALNRPAIGWNVSASHKLAFVSHTWWFPFAGTVPYKGFFDKKMAEEEEQKLIKKGLDTKIRTIGGYSTLGWISVPVMSPQLKESDDNLAGLVFHEMAHATVYFPDDTVFNESYASFIEEEGVKLYYTEKEGPASPTLEKREQTKKKNRILLAYARETAASLKALYSSTATDEEKTIQKEVIINRFRHTLLNDPFLKHQINREKFLAKKINNEDFNGLFRYHSGYDFFHKTLKNSGFDFKIFHEEMKKLKNMSPDSRKKLLN